MAILLESHGRVVPYQRIIDIWAEVFNSHITRKAITGGTLKRLRSQVPGIEVETCYGMGLLLHSHEHLKPSPKNINWQPFIELMYSLKEVEDQLPPAVWTLIRECEAERKRHV